MAEDGKNAANMREYKFSNAKDGKHTKPLERLERFCGARCGKQSVGKMCLGCNCNAVYTTAAGRATGSGVRRTGRTTQRGVPGAQVRVCES